MRLKHLSRMAEVSAGDWNRLFDPAYPFIRHEFLDALERQGCVGGDTGWEPCHLLAEDEEGQVVGAAPLYLKQHSYGEFVFDFSWAEASHRIGKHYYPKFLNAIPFTPVSGPRFGTATPAATAALTGRFASLAADSGASSLHALFLEPAQAELIEGAGLLARRDVQFQWFNQGYADFDDFLATLRSDKRKKILRERRRVAEAGIHLEWRPGNELSAADWHAVYELYANTYEERGQAPYLTAGFLETLGRQPETPLRLVLARQDARLVAVALTMVGGDTLYGRHWGAAEHYHSLHFETCYYQGIEFCIQHGLRRFDAGVQGEHKLSRGFSPVVTRSAHLLTDQRLHAAVAHHLQREAAFVESRQAELNRHVPFKEGAQVDG
jgi:predicted N-acyltransferase